MPRVSGNYWDRVVPENRHPQVLWRVHSDAVNTDWLTRYLPSGTQRVLKTDLFDEALAPGLYPVLAARAATVVGIDIAVPTIRAARARYRDTTVATADVRFLPFASESFDVVISDSTLDHFESATDIGVGLQELRRVLRRGGRLLLTLDNLANPVVALRNSLPYDLLHGLGLIPYRVGATCTPHQLRTLLHAAGLDPIEMSAILHCPRVVAVALAAIVNRLGSSRTNERYLRYLKSFEALGRLPTRFTSGYFIAVVAEKR